MAKSTSSKRWLSEHFNDSYVQKAKQQGYRSRAVYKLIEIQEKDRIIKKGMTVVDLGAAPGGWSQYISHLVENTGKVFAVDILAMEPLANVHFIQGDFTDDEVLQQLAGALVGQKLDLVISDMAPNMSGLTVVDQPKAMYLAELALQLAEEWLKPGGCFLVKLFHGTGFDEYVKDVRTKFKKVVIRKPKASRDRSKEAYLLAKDYTL